jgi:cyclophilin family peptidyl-prolyl cis-trans isomerase
MHLQGWFSPSKCCVFLVGEQVFGRVIEGMDVVKAIEAQGSQDGKPKKTVIVADSGELPIGTS